MTDNQNKFVLANALVALCVIFMPSVMAQGSGVVNVYGQHVGGQVIYHYQITNNSTQPIAAVRIGWDKNNSLDIVPELASLPTGWDSRVYGGALPPGTFTTPTGWGAEVMLQEETLLRGIEFGTVDEDHSYDILPGQTLNGLSITLPQADETYLKSHALVLYAGSYPPNATVLIERRDVAPPTLALSVSPARLQAKAGSLVTVTVTLVVADDYDPKPEIKLESITANEPLASGDVSSATFGTDDRQFQLRDVKVPPGTSGRIYTITYSATDASGNKATTSANVNVK